MNKYAPLSTREFRLRESEELSISLTKLDNKDIGMDLFASEELLGSLSVPVKRPPRGFTRHDIKTSDKENNQ